MTLTPRERNLVKSSWLLLKAEAGISNQLVFYEAFFDVAPDAKKYFTKKNGGQADFTKLTKKFTYTMDFIVNNIDNLENKPNEIADLGSIHKKLKIDSKYYSLFNKSLIILLDELLGNRATEEVKTAWSKVLQHITERMQAAPVQEKNQFRELLDRLFGTH